MSGRSSAPSTLAVLAGAALAAGCASKPAKPEADPGKVTSLAATMIDRMPPPGFKECDGAQVVGGFTVTAPTLLALAGQPVPADPEFRDWVNPPELDAPAARTLIDAKATSRAKRQAAAEALAAPFYLVYRVDLVNAPIALAIKELKRGTVGARAIRFDEQGTPVCTRLFYWQNDKAKSDWAIKASDRAVIDPAIAKAMQDDLRAQLLIRIGKLAQPQETVEMPERIPDGISN